MNPPDSSPQITVTDAIEMERRRFAMLLQDEIINQIQLILSQVTLYERVSTSAHEITTLNMIHNMVRGLLQRVLDLEASLHPALLESLGLPAALETLSNQQKRAYGLNMTLNLPRMRERLPAPVELAIFRTTQDFVMRAVKHSSASQIVISLRFEDMSLIYLIEDNGTFSPFQALDHSQHHLRQAGASLTQQQSKYGGLQLKITFTNLNAVDFTEREREVLILIAEGLTNKEIAMRLDVRPRTVKFHLDNIFSKLQISTRTEAAVYAMRHGLTK